MVLQLIRPNPALNLDSTEAEPLNFITNSATCPQASQNTAPSRCNRKLFSPQVHFQTSSFFIGDSNGK